MKAAPFSLHPSMGPAVLAHLRQFADTETLKRRHPGATEIFVAGQAVASALSELYGDGRCVAYNDVDAFVMDPQVVRDRQILATLDFEHSQFALDYGRLVVELVSVYDVRKTARTGMLNEVVCRPGVDFARHPARSTHAFLNSFDLNCVQVGVRLSDGALAWTPAFEEFLRTRQMLVMNVKTPVHTAIRWIRKKAELAGVYGHDEHAMQLLAAMAQRAVSRMDADSLRYRRVLQAQTQFGPQYAAKAQAVATQLAPYFELQPVSQAANGKSLALATLVPRAGIDARLLDKNVEDSLLPLYARALQGHWRRPVCERVLEVLGRPREHLARVSLSVHGMDVVTSTRSNAHLDQMDLVYRKHPGLAVVLNHLDVSQQHAFVSAVASLAREKGLWAYGIFEQLSAEHCRELGETDATALAQAVVRRFEAQCAELERLAAQGAQRAGEVGPLAATEYGGFRLRLLITFQDLAQEGERLHHCVAGYFASVTEGSTRIVSLRKPRAEDSLTMELRRVNGRWRLHQLRGLQNRSATQDERKIALRYAAAVNLQAALGAWSRRLPAATLLGAVERLARVLPESLLVPGALGRTRAPTRRKRLQRWWRTRVMTLLVGPDVSAYLVRHGRSWASAHSVPGLAFWQAMAKSAGLRLATAAGVLSKEQANSRLTQRVLDVRSKDVLEADLPF
jgi:hypothetical protein